MNEAQKRLILESDLIGEGVNPDIAAQLAAQGIGIPQAKPVRQVVKPLAAPQRTITGDHPVLALLVLASRVEYIQKEDVTRHYFTLHLAANTLAALVVTPKGCHYRYVVAGIASSPVTVAPLPKNVFVALIEKVKE